MTASSSRLPTLRELDDKLNISGLRNHADDEEARTSARNKDREEQTKDRVLQERVNRVRERLRAMIELKKARGEKTGECETLFVLSVCDTAFHFSCGLMWRLCVGRGAS